MSPTTLEQRSAALAKAQRARVAMSDLRASIIGGVVAFAEAIEDPAAGPMLVHDLLKLIHRVGDCTARRVEVRAGAPGHLRIRQLTYRQRSALVAELYRELSR